MRQLLLFMISIVTATTGALADNSYVIHDPDGKPVSGAKVTIYSAEMDSIGSAVSDTQGRVTVNSEKFSKLLVDSEGHSPRLIDRSEQPGGKITLITAKELKEVSVTEELARQYLTHMSYRIPQSEMKRYATPYLALNTIPNLTVLPSGDLFYEGNSNVKLLLNGVETTQQELSALAKDDISEIKVYQTPPVRYAGMGVASVIEVITKSNLTGGNVGIGIRQWPIPINGQNYAVAYYNYRRSKFSVEWNNDNSHFTKFRKNERLKYTFDGVEYDKNKRGLDSKRNRDNNSITIGYQNNLNKSYLYSFRSGVDFNRYDGNFKQEVTADGNKFPADKTLNTRYNRYWAANYFEKFFGEGGSVATNVVYQRYNTSYKSRYDETPAGTTPDNALSENSGYSTHLDAVIAQMMCIMPEHDWGEISLDIYNTYKNSRYVDIASPFSQRSNQFNAAAQFYTRKGKFFYQAQLGIKSLYTKSEAYDMSYSRWIPTPSAWISYRLNRKMRLRLSYAYDGDVPTIAQLSETDQWMDTKLVYHGNSKLKPYREHKVGLTATFNNDYVEASLSGEFKYSPDWICNHFETRPDYILETMINLDRYTSLSGQLDMTIKPLGNGVWTIWNRLIGAKIHGRSPGYKWDGYRIQWMVNNSVSLDRWYFNLYYQYPGKIAEGQLIRPRTQCWSLLASYRPTPDMLVGLEWWMPFGKSYKESERSVPTALVQTESENEIRGWANTVALRFIWNFSFGKRQNSARQKLKGQNDDSGILTK